MSMVLPGLHMPYAFLQGRLLAYFAEGSKAMDLSGVSRGSVRGQSGGQPGRLTELCMGCTHPRWGGYWLFI